MDERLKLAIVLVIYLALGWKIILTALRNILHGDVFDENFLMVVATIGALCIGEYEEAILVLLLYRIGEFLQDRAVNKSRKDIDALIEGSPDRDTIEDAAAVRADSEKFITRFARDIVFVTVYINLFIAITAKDIISFALFSNRNDIVTVTALNKSRTA